MMRLTDTLVCGWVVFVVSCVMALAHASGEERRLVRVGPSQILKTPGSAAAAARDGDEIEIEAGEYPGDVAVWSANHLTIRSLHGMARLQANGKSAQQKAIWVIRGNDTTVEGIEFSGCRVHDRNGAGIRQEGSGLVVRNCCFHDNENGILCGRNPDSDILVESSEFHHNGAGDGYSHNIYIGQIRRFTLQYCYSHDARIGHLVKSRAQTNFILYNRLTDGREGTSSYVIDLPNGGRSIIVGNIIQHGSHAQNGVAVTFAEEGAENAVQELHVVNNTYVNSRAASGEFLRVSGNAPMVRVINNLVVGTGKVLSGPGETINNLVTSQPGFVNEAGFDYRLAPDSPALGKGIDPGKAGGMDLTPAFYCRQPFGPEPRAKGEKLNVGACPAGTGINKLKP